MRAELIQAVARSAQLSEAQATLAVDGALRFLASRLPSPLFGELQSHLQSYPDLPSGRDIGLLGGAPPRGFDSP